MNKELEDRVKILESQMKEFLEWKKAKTIQQISNPLDVASRNLIGGAEDNGAGSSSLTQSVSISGDPESINVPAAYAGTRFIILDGVRYEIPYLS